MQMEIFGLLSLHSVVIMSIWALSNHAIANPDNSLNTAIENCQLNFKKRKKIRKTFILKGMFEVCFIIQFSPTIGLIALIA